MHIFSKFFSHYSLKKHLTSRNTFIHSLQEQFDEDSSFYSKVPLFYHDQTKEIEYMMIHPQFGLVLFEFFDHSFAELQGVTASSAEESDEKIDIEFKTNRNFLQLRLDQVFTNKSPSIHSVLICTQLSEKEFDTLDKSFHQLIPKSLSLFKGSLDVQDKISQLGKNDLHFDIDKVKLALFSELIVPETNSLMSLEQQRFMHLDLQDDLLIRALPGSGKSSLLVAKALYEKMKNPKLRLIIFAPRACNVHHIQTLIFHFLENSRWGLNPADINVSSFESLQKRSKEKEKYDLIACDDINKADLPVLKSLLNKNAHLLSSSHYEIQGLAIHNLIENFRLSPELSAACEGIKLEGLENSLVFKHGNTYMNTLLILGKLLKEVEVSDISIVHFDTQQRKELNTQINEYFSSIAYLFDDPDKQTGILLYPLSQMACINSPYIIVILDEKSKYDPIEVISRADKTSFILGESEAIYNTITQIQGLHNETD